MRNLAWLLVLALLPGCYESFADPTGPRSDGGFVFRDGAVPRPVDAGTPRPVDAGTPRPVDAGTPRPVDAGTPRDVCTDGERVPPYEGPGCSPRTTACLEGCDSEPDPFFCQDECLSADPECVACYNETVISCGNTVGCQSEWDELACCTERACPGVGTGVDRLQCAADACVELFESYSDCLSERFGPCERRISSCFR